MALMESSCGVGPVVSELKGSHCCRWSCIPIGQRSLTGVMGTLKTGSIALLSACASMSSCLRSLFFFLQPNSVPVVCPPISVAADAVIIRNTRVAFAHHRLQSDDDAIRAIEDLGSRIPMAITYHWVEGNQDKTKEAHALLWPAQLNVRADKSATEHYKHKFTGKQWATKLIRSQ
jgi:hypothetical protein